MTSPITLIANLLMQLAILTPAVNDSIDKVRHLIDIIRKPGAGKQNQVDDLKNAIELQALVNKEINDKLRLIETVLQTMQKSLKILAMTGASAGCTIGLGCCGREISGLGIGSCGNKF